MTLAIDLRSGAATVACYVGEALGAFLVLAWRVSLAHPRQALGHCQL